MDYVYLLGIFILMCAVFENGSPERLNDFIKHYEILDYDPSHIHQKHERVKRWLQSYDERYKEEPSIALKFTAHNRNFHLRLKRDTETFSSNIKLDGDPNFSAHNAAHLFVGHLQDIPGSYVSGSIVRGVFGGKIILPEERFYVERSGKYFSPLQNDSFHSIIYSERDLEDPNHLGQALGCGLHSETHDWMARVKNSEIKPENIFDHDFLNSEKEFDTILTLEKRRGIRFLNETNNHNIHFPSATISRKKRNAQRQTQKLEQIIQGKDTTCTLHIKTDPMFWREIVRQQGTKERQTIREEILSIIGHHVKAANDIFSSTLFRWNEKIFKNIRFVVHTVKIETDEECEHGYNGTANPFCEPNIDVLNFLEIHSRSNHDAFCLSYAFTYRDFADGVLGLAWVASISAAGGICQKKMIYYDSNSPNMELSLNTGIVTFLNYGRRLPSRFSELTFTHELGHNFGSVHDPKECQPRGDNGNYVMYGSSTNGYLPNNIEFSECSLRTMSEILDQTLNSPTRPNCFVATDGAFCGNQIVEDGEECDCGYDSDECKENCCYPRKEKENPFPVQTIKDTLSCKRKPPALCSPSEGPCCVNSTCLFATKIDHGNIPCRKASECAQETFCNGATALCPTPIFKPNYTECDEGSQVCINGECRGSICLKFGLKECFLSSAEYKDKRELCRIACLDQNGFCKPTSELGVPNFKSNLSLRAGSPCDNFKVNLNYSSQNFGWIAPYVCTEFFKVHNPEGYCDYFQKCRAVDQKGPLLRLKRFLFNRKVYNGLFDWCVKNWWGVLLIFIGFCMFMALFIKCCAVHTPSSNPYMAERVKFTQTLRKPMNSLRVQKRPERNRGPDYGINEEREESFPMETRHP